MAQGNKGPARGEETDLVITRVFRAPRALVFKAWTEPERLMQWWAPNGCSTPFCTVDLRPGGRFHFCMRLPDGRDVWALGIYQEVVVPERIVYTDSFADADGNFAPPSRYGMSPGHPAHTTVTVLFSDHEEGTRVTLRHSIPESVEERKGTEQGWNEMFDRLAERLLLA